MVRRGGAQRRSSRIARLPPTSLLDLEVMEVMIHDLMSSTAEDDDEEGQIALLDQISSFLERSEEEFQRLIGIPYVASSVFNQRSAFLVPRSHFTVGRLAAIVQQEDVMDHVTERWVEKAEVRKQQRAAGLRLTHACMSVCGLQYPLTEEGFVSMLRHWAFDSSPQNRVDRSDESEAEEAIRAYSAGLLAIAFTDTCHCEEAVRSGFIPPLITYLHSTIGALDSSVELRASSSRQSAVVPQGNPHPIHRTLQGRVDSLPSTPGDPHSPDIGEVEMQDHLDAAVGTAFSDTSEDAVGADDSSLQTPRRLSRVSEKDDAPAVEPLASGSETNSALGTQAEAAQDPRPAPEQPVLNNTFAFPAPEAVGRVTLTAEEVRARRLQYLVQCSVSLGAYLEFLPSLLGSGGIKLILRLLDGWRCDRMKLHDGLQWLSSLLAHRKIADAVVDEGLELLLSLPKALGIQTALSVVFVGLALIPSALAKIATLPSPTLARFVAAAVEPLSGSEDPAKKSAAVFMVNAICQPAILAAFDELKGLRRVLAALSNTMLLLKQTGGRQEKQICHPLCQALSLYFRAHFVQRIATLRRCLGSADMIAVDSESLEDSLAALASSPELGAVFLQSSWLPAEDFIKAGGLSLMLDIIQTSPGERYFTEMALSALEVLGVVTLLPGCREALFSKQADCSYDPVSTLLTAAAGISFGGDEEVKLAALRVLVNCVAAPKAVSESSSGQDILNVTSDRGLKADKGLQRGFAAARQVVRSKNGLRTLLGLLESRPSASLSHPTSLLKMQTLTAQVLLGLAQDADICHNLSKLQVGKRLAELLHESAGATVGADRPGSDGVQIWSKLFAATAVELILLTTGMEEAESVAAMDAAAPALHKMERAAIAAGSHITYNPEELLGLIRDHLSAAGLAQTAEVLEHEAGLDAARFSRTGAAGEKSMWSRQQSGMVRKRISFAASLKQSLATLLHRRVQGSTEAHPAEQPASGSALVPAVLEAPSDAAVGGHPAAMEVEAARAETHARATLSAGASSEAVGKDGGCAGEDNKAPAAVGGCGDCPSPFRWGSRHAKLQQPKLTSIKRSLSEQLPLQLHPRLRERRGLSPQASSRGSGTPCRLQLLTRDSDSFLTPGVFRAATARLTALARPGLEAEDLAGRLEAAAPVNRPAAFLSGLPRRRRWAPEAAAERTCATPMMARSAAKAAFASPVGRNGAFAGAGDDRAAGSRLSAIVLQYLRQQHKIACLSAQQPVSTLPPLSLTHTNVLPQAKHMLDASSNAARRSLESQVAPAGGVWGRKQTRHFVYSRFRHRKSIRDSSEDGSVGARAGAFLCGGRKLVVGTEGGDLRVYNDLSSDVVEEYEAHRVPITKLQVFERGDKSLVLSACPANIKLWDATKFDREALAIFPGQRGVFSPTAAFAAVAESPTQTVCIWNLSTQTVAHRVDDTVGVAGLGPRLERDICYNQTGELLLYGRSLFDPRIVRRVHSFDQLSDEYGASAFHPTGLEAILNSEVWDLRTFRLLRSVPHLSGASLAFNSCGDIAYATLRRPEAGSWSGYSSHRSKRHPLFTAFATIDTTDYSEISRVDVDGRCVLDLASDPLDSFLALITADADGGSTSTRIYDIGRQRSEGDESDYEAGEGSDGRGSEDDDSDNSDEEPDPEEAALLRMSDAEGEPGDYEGGREPASEMEADAEAAEAGDESGSATDEGRAESEAAEEMGTTAGDSDLESLDETIRSETIRSHSSSSYGQESSSADSEPSAAASEGDSDFEGEVMESD